MLNSKTLRLMVDALSKSLKKDKKEVKFHIANAFNNSSWSKLEQEVANNTSPFQHLDNGEIEQTLHLMAETFSENLNIHITTAHELVSSIEPFTQDKPKAYRVDTTTKRDSEGSIDFQSLMEAAGGSETIFENLKELLAENPELEGLLSEGDSLESFQNRMRISHPINVGAYYDMLEGILGWNLNDDYYMEEYTYMEPSFHINTERDGLVPVYIFSYITMPGDTKDDLHNDIIDRLQDENDTALVIFKTPSFKEIHGTTYSVVGYYIAEGYWSYTLVSHIPPDEQHRIVGEDNYDLESPKLPVKLKCPEEPMPLYVICHSFLTHGADKQGIVNIPSKLPSIQGINGWKSYM